MTPVEIKEGSSPIILGLPHTGTYLPEIIFNRLNWRGQSLSDTDWHIHELYQDLLPQATTVRATFHRYVIDANRDPSGDSLYPGQNTTGLVPLTDFDGKPIWNEGEEPGPVETDERRRLFHAPYHAALSQQIERVRATHGVAILYDCHSIRSNIPFLFEGVLPDFNIGTNNGATCAAVIEQTVADICNRAEGFTSVTNGRFKGGWTTRHYGTPADNIHAIQMELAQSTHLESEASPYIYHWKKAEKIRPYLRDILQCLEQLALEGALTSPHNSGETQ